LKRDELVALNSTLLHELYFASLGGEGNKPNQAIAEALANEFGSMDRWRQEFIAMASALSGGSGWVVLTYVPRDRRLINQYASEHTQSIVSGVPILALDMYETRLSPGLRRECKRLHRRVHAQRQLGSGDDSIRGRDKDRSAAAAAAAEFGDLPAVGVEAVKAMIESGQPVQVIDARPRHYLSRQGDIAKRRPRGAIPTACRNDRRALQVRAGRHLLRLRFHVGCKTAIRAPGGRLRREIHEQRALWLARHRISGGPAGRKCMNR
jgi:Fe-Mn family superoxide dismutase